jgi:site-specific DNA-methyltransferase (adenine-specific)
MDCLDGMKLIADATVDMILCDLPYGTTQNKWDSVIPLESMWERYRRIIKPTGAIVLTAQMPFTITLGASNLSWLKYEWIWEKEQGTGFLNAKKAPLKSHENVLVFAPGKPTYNPQMEAGKPYSTKRGRRSTNYGADSIDEIVTVSGGLRYPKTVLRFNRDKNIIHPTQKPVALFEYLIRTYTNAGERVLDNCMGSGTTAIACINADRRYVGFELNAEYFNKAANRINNRLDATPSLELPQIAPPTQTASLDCFFQ